MGIFYLFFNNVSFCIIIMAGITDQQDSRMPIPKWLIQPTLGQNLRQRGYSRHVGVNLTLHLIHNSFSVSETSHDCVKSLNIFMLLNSTCFSLPDLATLETIISHLVSYVTTKGHPYVKSGLDMVCWDILGKASGLPFNTLIGGNFNKRGVLCYIGQNTPKKWLKLSQSTEEKDIRGSN